MRKPLRCILQALQVPQRVARGAKKHSPHIIVYTEHFVPLTVEMLHRLGADQPAAAGDQNFHRAASLSKKAHQPGSSSALAHLAINTVTRCQCARPRPCTLGLSIPR